MSREIILIIKPPGYKEPVNVFTFTHLDIGDDQLSASLSLSLSIKALLKVILQQFFCVKHYRLYVYIEVMYC